VKNAVLKTGCEQQDWKFKPAFPPPNVSVFPLFLQACAFTIEQGIIGKNAI